MKKLFLILLLISCFGLTSCSRDAEADAFMKEYAAVTREIAEKIEAGDPDAARAAFEAKKGTLDAKWDAVKRSLPFQLTPETKKRMNGEPEKNMTDLAEAAKKGIEKNRAGRKKIEALVLDLANVFRR